MAEVAPKSTTKGCHKDKDSNSTTTTELFHSTTNFRELADMWHPHVYKEPPKSPTPFSIDDILKRPKEEADSHMTRLLPDLTHVLAHHMVAAAMQHQTSTGSTGRDSLQSTPPLASSSNAGDDNDEDPQPLNLTTKRDSGGDSTPDLYDLNSKNKSDLVRSSNCHMKGMKRKIKDDVVSKGDSTEDEDDRKKKKVRTTFTGRQIFELEKMFETKKYLSSSERSDMAKLLNVTEQQVKIWFQNRRTKWKKQENISNAEAAELMKAKSNNSKSSDKSTKQALTENGLSALLGKLSPGPSPSPFLRPPSSSGSTSSLQMQQHNLDDSNNQQQARQTSPRLVSPPNNSFHHHVSSKKDLPDPDDILEGHNRLVIAESEPVNPHVDHNKNNHSAAAAPVLPNKKDQQDKSPTINALQQKNQPV